jgi:hypothetical protein
MMRIVYLLLVSSSIVWGIVPFPDHKSDSMYYAENRRNQIYFNTLSPLASWFEIFDLGYSRQVLDGIALEFEVDIANTTYDKKVGGKIGLAGYPAHCFDGWRFSAKAGIVPYYILFERVEITNGKKEVESLSASAYAIQADIGMGYDFVFSNGFTIGFFGAVIFANRISEASSQYKNKLLNTYQVDYFEIVKEKKGIKVSFSLPLSVNI